MSHSSKSRTNRINTFIHALLLIAIAAALYLVMSARTDYITAITPTPTPTPTVVPTPSPTPVPTPSPTPVPTPRSLTISAAGDCTLGGDMGNSSERNFTETIYADDDPMTYCFRNVADIFAADDLTIINLEVVLTDSSDTSDRSDKIFFMRGKPEYVEMLTRSSIEVANIANNHTTDFGDAGMEEMAALLDANSVGYCGFDYTYLTEVNDLTVGFVGFNLWGTDEDSMEKLMDKMRPQCDILIVSMHGGTELEYDAVRRQTKFGRLAVDYGADLVLGHHPHVVNGIEVYKGVSIVYSLGNFCFGGNRNPKDKDTFIYQHTFTENEDGTFSHEPKVIPCKITSVEDESYNNYQPTPVTDPEKARAILEKIEKHSRQFDKSLDLVD